MSNDDRVPNANKGDILFNLLRQPNQGRFEAAKASHLPTVDEADEGEHPGTAVRVGNVNQSQAQPFGKAELVKCLHQGGEVLRAV